jgi:hypothetical protein
MKGRFMRQLAFRDFEGQIKLSIAAIVADSGYVAPQMSTLNSELYDALKEAGASESSARKAAEPVAAFENRFARIDTDLAVLKWMLGFNLATTVAVLFMLVRR